MAKRNLYLNNTPVDEALEKYLDVLRELGSGGTRTENVEVISSLGRITANAVYARCSSPLYDSAAMDGIAVKSPSTRGARENEPVTLTHGEDYIVVDTGDPVLPPYDAVIMAEDIEEHDEDRLIIRAAAAPWQHVRPVGEDIVQGEMILPGGHRIRPVDIGVLLSGGIVRLETLKVPTVAIFPTGTELVEPGDEPEIGDIIESNTRMFEAIVLEQGGEPVRFPAVPDDYKLLKSRISDAADNFDMVIVNAGSSAGTEDYTVHILRELGEVIIHGVAMKPGKPVILATVRGKPVIGLPGYPVSAYIAFMNFAEPTLRLLTGKQETPQRKIEARVTRRIVSSLKYREYVRVKVGEVGGRLIASPLARGAGAAMSLVRADGFCVIDQNAEGIEAGEDAEILLMRDLQELYKTLVIIGSHDLILDVIGDILPNTHGFNLSSTHVGSLGGLMALKNGETHIASTHLLDEETGEYNVHMIRKLFGGRHMALIKGVRRVQGIMVQKGNPLGITAIADLTQCRYINRQRGAGTRVLLDYKLKCLGIEPESITGYDREAATHMAVAAAVSGGSADAGLGISSSAKAMGLDFIPVGYEDYDFALPRELLTLPAVEAFIEVLKSDEFAGRLSDLGGYACECTGEIVLIQAKG